MSFDDAYVSVDGTAPSGESCRMFLIRFPVWWYVAPAGFRREKTKREVIERIIKKQMQDFFSTE